MEFKLDKTCGEETCADCYERMRAYQGKDGSYVWSCIDTGCPNHIKGTDENTIGKEQ